jgi:hypothetical protein
MIRQEHPSRQPEAVLLSHPAHRRCRRVGQEHTFESEDIQPWTQLRC